MQEFQDQYTWPRWLGVSAGVTGITYLALYYSTVYATITHTIPDIIARVVNWRSVGWIGRHLMAIYNVLSATTGLYVLLSLTVLSGILAGLAIVGLRVQMPLGGAVAVALGMAIAVMGIIVLILLWLDALRKAREGYIPAPTSMYDRGAGIERIPPQEMLEFLSKGGRGESDLALKRRLTGGA